MGISLNPFTGFGLLETGLEYLGDKNLQNDSQEHSAQMFGMQSQHDKDMFGLESKFVQSSAKDQYNRQRALLQDSPGLQMQGLKSAGLNPILAATGGFKSPAGGAMPIPHASAKSSAKGDSTSSPSLSRPALASAHLMKKQADLVESQKNKTDAETRRIQSEQPKKDFFQFFWKVYNGTIQQFDKAFKEWSESNKQWMGDFMDKYGLSWQSVKDDFRQYVIDAPPGKNPVSGGQGRKKRRGK